MEIDGYCTKMIDGQQRFVKYIKLNIMTIRFVSDMEKYLCERR